MKHALDEIIDRVRAMPEPEAREILSLARASTRDRQWMPNTGPQTKAMQSLADEVLFGGEPAGGKTDLGIGLAITEHQRSLLLRRQNNEVQGLVDRMEQILKSRQGYTSTPHMLWRLPGRLIFFGGCQHLADRTKYQGVPKDFIFFDELANFLEGQYRFIILWNRSVTPGQRCRVLASTNPATNPEGLWINKYWGAWLDPHHPNPALDGEIRWYTTIDEIDVEVAGPGQVVIDGTPLVDKDGLPVFPKSRTFIRSALKDNPELQKAGYGATLASASKELQPLARGDFAASMRDDIYQVFPGDWIDQAMARWSEEGRRAPMTVIGVDIAQGGKDQTTLAPRHGMWFDRLKVYPGKDTPDGPTVAGLVFMAMRDGCEIILDMGGGYGGSTRDHLKQVLQPTIFNGAEAGMGRDRTGAFKFHNRRAEATWRLRDALDPDYGAYIALPPDQELKQELCSLRFKNGPQGILISSKEDVKEIIGHSPDRGDAVIMAHYARGKTNHVPQGIANLQRKAIVSSRRPPRR